MKRFLAIALAASLGLVMAGSASAGTFQGDYTVGSAANGIGTSRHNLGGFGEHVVTPNTTEICIFCHTPHHTNTGLGPIWNRNINTTSFTAYGDTVGGSTINTVLGPSLACLSCHDGVTTFDNLVNRPGKDVKGSSIQGTYVFTEGGTDYNVLNGLAGPGYALGHSGRLDIGDTGPNAKDAGAGLSNDHPVGVEYSDGAGVSGKKRASLRDRTTIISTIDLAADLAASATNGTVASGATGIDMGQNLWAVGGFISDTATISDLLRGAGGNVECASCHDPHFNNASWTEVEETWGSAFESQGLFLRRVQGNSGSGVCRTCHNK